MFLAIVSILLILWCLQEQQMGFGLFTLMLDLFKAKVGSDEIVPRSQFLIKVLAGSGLLMRKGGIIGMLG
ncbi:hypothetical protein SDJN02_07234, partial [Cucurbita argyrosperma subsp. argyrosperma]